MTGVSHRRTDSGTRKPSTTNRVAGRLPKRGAEMSSACSIEEKTALVSLNHTALTLAHVGEILQIEYRPGPPALVVAMTKAGTAAGALDSSLSIRVADCIKLGARFVAKVLLLEERRCIVYLRRRRR